MQYAEQFIEFLIAAYGVGIGAWPMVRTRRFPGGFVLCLAVAVMMMPLIIEPEFVILRALSSLLAIDLFFKIIDYRNQRTSSDAPGMGFVTYCRFLVPFPVLLVRFTDRPSRQRCDAQLWWSAALALLAFGGCCILLLWMSCVSVLQASFLLDHTVKLVLFVFAIESLSRLIHRLETIVGYATKPLIDSAFLSRTVGEFWSRYNTRVHDWFHHNVFLWTKGKRSPVLAVFQTFFMSGLLHELGFAVATSRIDGYQFLFFLLQAPAVIFGHAAQRFAAANAVAVIALRCFTVLWLWATSMLFFHGVDRVFLLFYASTPWLS